MAERSVGTRDVRLSWTILLAAALATLGVVRLFCDFLTDIDPTWVSVLGESPLRLLARTTDGLLVGNLNTQYFKVMAMPSAAGSESMSHTPGPLTMRRVYSAPPARIFEAWVDPSLASRWLFATPDGRIVRCDLNVRPGGVLVITDRRGGDEVEHRGPVHRRAEGCEYGFPQTACSHGQRSRSR